MPSLFRIILQTDRRISQSDASIKHRSTNAAFLPQSLWSFLHSPSFGIDHGTLDVCVDQIRLLETGFIRIKQEKQEI